MAVSTSFVESATLRVIDESSSTINKINQALANLEKTAARLAKGAPFSGDANKAATRGANELAQATERVGKSLGGSATAGERVGRSLSTMSKQAEGAVRNMKALETIGRQWNGFNLANKPMQVTAAQIRAAQEFIAREYNTGMRDVMRNAETTQRRANEAMITTAQRQVESMTRASQMIEEAQARARAAANAAGAAAPAPPRAVAPPPPLPNESRAEYERRLAEREQALERERRATTEANERADARDASSRAEAAERARIEAEKRPEKAPSNYMAAAAAGTVAAIARGDKTLSADEKRNARVAQLETQRLTRQRMELEAQVAVDRAAANLSDRRDKLAAAQEKRDLKMSQLEERTRDGKTTVRALSEYSSALTREGDAQRRVREAQTAVEIATRRLADIRQQNATQEQVRNIRAETIAKTHERDMAKAGAAVAAAAGGPPNHGGPPSGRGFRGYAGQFGGEVRDVFKGMAAFGVYGWTMGRLHSAREGIEEIDNERSLLELAGYSPAEQAAMEKRSHAMTGKYLGIGYANTLENAREAAALSKGDSAAADRIALEQAKAQALLGIGYRDTRKGGLAARFLGRAVEQSIHISDHDKPEDVAAQYEKTYDAVLRGLLSGNVQLQNAQQIFSNWRNAGPSVRSFTEDALGTFIHMQLERAGKAGADVRTFMADLTRSNLNKEGKAAMTRFGLRDGRGNAFSTLAKRASADPYMFAINEIGPKLKAMGIDLDDPAAVAAGLVQMGFTQTAVNLPQLAISQRHLIEEQRKRAHAVKVDDKTAQKVSRETVSYAIDSLSQQWQQLADRIVKPIEKPFARLVSDVAKRMHDVAADEQASVVRKASLGLTGGAVVAATSAFGWLKDNPEKAGLMGAAAALTGAAGALTGAAGKLALTGGVGALGTLGKLAKGGLAVGAIAVGTELAVGALNEYSDRKWKEEMAKAPKGERAAEEYFRRISGVDDAKAFDAEWKAKRARRDRAVLGQEEIDAARAAAVAAVEATEAAYPRDTSDMDALNRRKSSFWNNFITPAYADNGMGDGMLANAERAGGKGAEIGDAISQALTPLGGILTSAGIEMSAGIETAGMSAAAAMQAAIESGGANAAAAMGAAVSNAHVTVDTSNAGTDAGRNAGPVR